MTIIEVRTGEDVKVMRQQLEMTQETFAHLVGVTVSTVNRWEKGRTTISKLACSAINVACERLKQD